jgi:hypothetical protein
VFSLIDDVRREDLPQNLQALFDGNKVDQTYCLALGQGESYVIAYLGYDGFGHIRVALELNLLPELTGS